MITGSAADIQSVAKKVDLALTVFFDTKILEASAIDNEYADLWRICKNYLLTGGKRIRPYLCLLMYQAYDGDRPEQMLPVICTWELIHAAMLVHDDIIDRDTMRHGALNIHGTYAQAFNQAQVVDGEHIAEANGILAGDLFISSAFEVVMNSDLEPDRKVRMLEYLNGAIFRVIGGEFLDVQTSYKAVQAVNTPIIMKHKTASYSFELPMTSGAYLAGAPQEQIDILAPLGEKVGITFQLIDDLLGVFGDEATTGKSIDSDIVEKKKTLLLQYTYDNLGSAERVELSKIYVQNHHVTESDVERVRSLIRSSGADIMIKEKSTQLSMEAKRLVDTLSVQDPYKKALCSFIDTLLQRKK